MPRSVDGMGSKNSSSKPAKTEFGFQKERLIVVDGSLD
jgi:hypothetical protein